MAKAGAKGNCVRETRSCGFFLWRSKYHTRLQAATGYAFSPGTPSICQHSAVSNFTYTVCGNVFQSTTPSCASPEQDDQPTIVPRHPFRMPRRLSKCSVARTGMPTQSGNKPYNPPHSWSCRCNHCSFSAIKAGFSWRTAAEALSRATATYTVFPRDMAHCMALRLFTWYLMSFVPKIATAVSTASESSASTASSATSGSPLFLSGVGGRGGSP